MASGLRLPDMPAVERARQLISRHLTVTPVVSLPEGIHLKLECLQPTGSFKVRAALASLPDEGGPLRTASAGNMGAAVAWVAHRAGVAASVVVPEDAPAAKTGRIEALGAHVERVPFDEWWRLLTTAPADDRPGRFVHPFADEAVMAGNGTIALELLEQCPAVDAVVVPFGGGGLVAGIAAVVRTLRPDVAVYAAEVTTAAPLRAAVQSGAPVPVARTASFVDGIGSTSVHPDMWPLLRHLGIEPVAVTLEATAAALRRLAEAGHVVAEGAAAAALAAAEAVAHRHTTTVAVVSGGNIDLDVFASLVAGRRAQR